MLDGLRLAITMFTILPVPVGRVDRRTSGIAMAFVPVVGAGLALAAAAVVFVCRLQYPGDGAALLGAALGIATLALLTRGLHLDGLVDTVDGLASRAPRERALSIMAEPQTGALGVGALVLVLLVQVLALYVCVGAHRGTESLLLATLTSRLAAVWACTTGVPPARSEGLGAMVAGTVRRRVAAVLTLLVAVEAVGYGWLDQDAGGPGGAVRALIALAVGLLLGAWLRRLAVRRLGGVTGDVLGAVIEVTFVVVLLLMAPHRPSDLTV
jgi:adenosylcobinamide-GDP ribazoletransferase